MLGRGEGYRHNILRKCQKERLGYVPEMKDYYKLRVLGLRGDVFGQ